MDDPSREARFKEYDKMGELEVRRYMAEGRLNEINMRLANSWLQVLEAEREASREAAAAAHLAAAQTQADAASSQARAAREANKIARTALVIAIAAAIISIVALFRHP